MIFGEFWDLLIVGLFSYALGSIQQYRTCKWKLKRLDKEIEE